MTQGDFLIQIAEHLEAVGIPFMVVGSLSSSFYSLPRSTNDVDLVIDATREQLDRFLDRVREKYYASPEAARDALARRAMFNVIQFDTGWKVDLIVRKNRPFSVEEFSRRQSQSIHGRTLPMAAIEDVILSKLEWNKITPSERQVDDAKNVAAVQWGSLDIVYLEKWGAILGVTESLREVLSRAEEQRTS